MEIVYYSDDKKYAFFNGIKYGITPQGYFRATLREHSSKKNISRLHRAIWSYHNGDIPEGHDIHHKDENKSNNDISNLACMKHKHHSIHHLDISLGKSWYEKPEKTYVCSYCGKLFESVHAYGENQNKYCSSTCGDKFRYKEKHEKEWEKVCPHCGKFFIAKRSDQIYCNNICAQVVRTKRYRQKKKEKNNN